MKHTILGSGGPISNELRKQLSAEGKQVRLVSRRKIQTGTNTEWKGADLLEASQVMEAVKGSQVVYLCAGLKYDKQVWAKEWPLLINNVITACKAAGARLLFFDNVYSYGRVNGPIVETSPYKPLSIKGEIRAEVASTLMKEVQAGNLQGSIARAADFYGAESLNSFYDAMVLVKYAKKEKAMWLGNPANLHSFTYVPDAGRAMALLGNTPSSDNQIWHLPTAPAQKGIEFISLAADHYGSAPSYIKVNKLILNTLGIFMKMMKETSEMYYQYEFDYDFNSKKFEKYFNVAPTTYKDGVTQFSEFLLKKKVEKGEAMAA